MGDERDHRRRVLNIWRQLEHRHAFCPRSIGILPDVTLMNDWKCHDCRGLFPEMMPGPNGENACPCLYFRNDDHVDARADLALDGKLAGLEHLTYLDREG